MKKAEWVAAIAGLLFASGAMAQSAGKGPTLSPAEQAIINRQIKALRSPADRHIAQNWSDAKKMAELICRPVALPVLKTTAPDADKVFLGTDDPKTLTLISDKLLKGSGEFRTPQGWKDFTFTCEVDPQTGTVVSFQPERSSGQ
jgi:hypothetical protein